MFDKKILLSVLVNTALYCVGGLAQNVHAEEVSQKEERPTVAFPAMTQDEVDRFRDSLKNSVPLEALAPRVSQVVESKMVGLWAGTKTEVTTDIREVILRFRPTTEELLARSVTAENASKALLEYVDLKLSIAFGSLQFIHSHPEDGREVGGFKAKVKDIITSTRVKMILGQRESGMYVAIPPLQSPDDLWGAYVCPRSIRYESVRRTGGRVLYAAPSPYDLSEVFLSVEADGKAVYEASRGKVRAATTLQLSSELPESEVASDESISGVAEPKIRYRPKFPFDFFRFAPNTDLQQGVNVVVELQNRTGHIRRQNFSHVVSIHKSNEPSPVPVLIYNVSPKGDTGDCYIVKVQKYSWKEYDKTANSF